MEVDATKIVAGIAGLALAGGSAVGTNEINSSSNEKERQEMREMHHQELSECNRLSDEHLEEARTTALKLIEDQRTECQASIDRCMSLLVGKE